MQECTQIMVTSKKPHKKAHALRNPAHADPLVPASFPSGPAWYVANTFNHRERRAKAEIAKLGFDAFLPIERYRAKISSRRTVEKERPLIPQYVFVQFDINKDGWELINRADSIRRLLDMDGIPRAAPTDFVEGLQNALQIGLFDQTTAHLRMDEGDELEVLDGPFKDFIGTFIGASTKKRVDLLLNIFGRPTRVSFDVDQVRKLG